MSSNNTNRAAEGRLPAHSKHSSSHPSKRKEGKPTHVSSHRPKNFDFSSGVSQTPFLTPPPTHLQRNPGGKFLRGGVSQRIIGAFSCGAGGEWRCRSASFCFIGRVLHVLVWEKHVARPRCYEPGALLMLCSSSLWCWQCQRRGMCGSTLPITANMIRHTDAYPLRQADVSPSLCIRSLAMDLGT